MRGGCALPAAALLAVAVAAAAAVAADGPAHSVHVPLELRPPRAADDIASHGRGFPRVTTVFALDAPSLSRGARVRRRVLALLGRASADALAPAARASYSADLLGGITRVGEYYTKIEVGGQKVRVQIDTGSSTLALPMAECKDCLPSDLRYNIRRSTNPDAHVVSCTNELCAPDMCGLHKCERCSAKDACCAEENPSGCAFRLKYGDGSYAKGALVIDTLSWGSDVDRKGGNSSLSAPVVFGGILSDSSEFERPIVDGIMGFAYEALACNPTCVEPPFQQLVKAGVVKDMFTICMTQRGGKLILGDLDPSIAKGPITYVPLALSRVPTFYTVNMSSTISIGDGKLKLPNFRYGVVDSGTTLLGVSAITFQLILDYMQVHYCHIPHMCDAVSWFSPASCVIISDDILQQLPTLTFHLGDRGEFDLALKPEDYMVENVDQGRVVRCVGFMALKRMSPGTDMIFGNTIMLRYLTVYDRANKRMGFAESKKSCGAPTHCSAYTQCLECAAEPECAFNFATQTCLPSSDAGRSMFSFPVCRGSSCACGLGQQAYFVYGLGTGLVSALIALGALVALLTLCGVVGGRADATAVTAPEQEAHRASGRSAAGDEPLPLMENEKA